jgi:hypothetical protein
VAASVGSRGDSYDNALAESFNGLYKTEVIRQHGPWRNLDNVEYAALEYVDWFNQRRLHGEIGMIPPAEFEAFYYHHGTQPWWPSPNHPSLYETRGGSGPAFLGLRDGRDAGKSVGGPRRVADHVPLLPLPQ